MLFKLALKNIRKSIKDYSIYFFTLVIGVIIFYIFNALDTQTAMLDVSSSTREIIRLMTTFLSGVSVFVAVVLGALIIYASNFLIKRRKNITLIDIKDFFNRKIRLYLFEKSCLISF